MSKYFIIPLVIYLLIIGYLYFRQKQLMYFPTLEKPQLSEHDDSGKISEVTLKTTDGLALNAWFQPPEDGQPVIIHFHGNSGSIADFVIELQEFADEGIGVLWFDYRGFGGNPGEIDKEGLLTDGRAAIDFVSKTQGVPVDEIIFFGKSLGTGVATQLASETTPAALILESPYTRISDVAADKYWFVPLVRYLLVDNYSVIDHIGQVTAPLIVLHAAPDVVVPMKFGKMSFDAANDPKEMHVFDDANHANLHEHGAAQKVLTFLKTHQLVAE